MPDFNAKMHQNRFRGCIGDDTKAAARLPRQRPNCIKKTKKIKYGEKRFSICRMEFLHSYTLQCGTLHWDHDIEFARWQHPAMWQVALA